MRLNFLKGLAGSGKTTALAAIAAEKGSDAIHISGGSYSLSAIKATVEAHPGATFLFDDVHPDHYAALVSYLKSTRTPGWAHVVVPQLHAI